MPGPDAQAEAANADESLNRHYGKQVVRRSLRHFLMGKGVKFFATLAALLILARWMETAEYGAYIAMRGFIEIARAFTAIGISAVLFRYLPELRAKGNSQTAYALLRNGLLLRAATITLALLAVLPFTEQLGLTFNIGDWVWVIPIALAVGGLEFIAITYSQSLESFMWQKEAQFSLAAGNVLKVLMFLGLVFLEELTLLHVFLAEGLGWLFIIAFLSRGLLLQWRKDEHRNDGEPGWIRNNIRRMARFGAWAFGLSLTSSLYGPGPNRLVVAHYLPIADLASFGFASNLHQFVRRMMPTTLGSTMIRPLLVANYAVSSNFDKAVRLANLIYRFNVSLLVIPMGILLIGGEILLDLATDGKYGSAAIVVAGFLAVLMVEGLRQLLDLIAQAVERNDLTVASSVVLSASLFVAIALTPVFGVWGVVGANFVGILAANLTLAFLLARAGFRFWLQWKALFMVIGYGVIAVVFGQLARDLLGDPMIGSMVGTAVFLVGYFVLFRVKPPFDAEERKTIRSMTKRGKRGGGEGQPEKEAAS